MRELNRRGVIGLLGGAAAWPLAARAQQRGGVRRIGVFILGTETNPVARSWVAAFQEGLQELGWFDGRNVRIDVRFATESRGVHAAADELVALAPDLILSHSSPGTTVIRDRTKTIPVVFVAAGDPLANGIVESIARPGGNVTGFTNLTPSFGGKWLELLKEAMPAINRVGLLFNPELFFSKTYFESIEATAKTWAVEVVRVPYRNADELVAAVDMIGAEPNHGVIVVPPIGVYPPQFFRRLEERRLPAIGNVKAFAAAGGLMSYGADNADLFRRSATYVDRILRGDRPGDLPVQFPTRFEMVINLKTAKAIGLTVPSALSAQATEVIE
jgi:putative tryptophan/tyrosine transport system substrate-binding protein